MKVIRETVVAGRTILRSVKTSTKINASEEKRNRKINPTSEAVWKVNLRNKIKALTIKLNHNFRLGDWHLTLTYAGEPPSPKKAKKDKENFLRRLRELAKKEEVLLKRIDVTEYKQVRIHHHIVCSYLPFEKIQKLWPHGKVRPSDLDETGNYYRLAEYLIKEQGRTYREEPGVYKRGYNCSRTIVTPVPKREIVSERQLRKDPEEIKGYYVDPDTIRRYEHAITGADCLEYILVSKEKEPRLKRWNKGKLVKWREYYKPPIEHQIDFEGFGQSGQ